MSASEQVTSGREQRVLEIIETARSKRPRFRDQQITLAHGAGGQGDADAHRGAARAGVLERRAGALAALGDAGAVEIDGARLAMTSDSFVVKPLRFPGGSIGELAVNGTVNDLAVSGARAVALTISMILEEGLPADVLRAEVEAIADAARVAGVEIVGGDTKVVERGAADGMYLSTTGIGARRFARARWPPTRSAPATTCSCPGRSASTARRSCSRATSSSSTPRSSPTRAHCGRRSTPSSVPPATPCIACATRRAVASRRS